ncbi:MAG TPA: hypothetical protein VL738_30610 [Dactylosporangium sp.]|nr:hypothetical protein [Dactylosporangium sp.]
MREIVGLAVLLIVAVATSAVADLSRLRTVQAEESDLTAEMARQLLHAEDLPAVLPGVAQCITQPLHLPDATIHLAAVPADDRHSAFPLRDGAVPLGTLVVPVGVPERTIQRLRERVVPSLASLLHAGCERAAVLDSLEASREHLRQLVAEQVALGRVANLVASGRRPPEVFDAITTELHELLGEHSTYLYRYEPDGTDTLHLSIRDDGVGGADPTRGTGLTELRDRVEALGGHLSITSPTDGGTMLLATIPTTSAPGSP